MAKRKTADTGSTGGKEQLQPESAKKPKKRQSALQTKFYKQYDKYREKYNSDDIRTPTVLAGEELVLEIANKSFEASTPEYITTLRTNLNTLRVIASTEDYSQDQRQYLNGLFAAAEKALEMKKQKASKTARMMDQVEKSLEKEEKPKKKRTPKNPKSKAGKIKSQPSLSSKIAKVFKSAAYDAKKAVMSGAVGGISYVGSIIRGALEEDWLARKAIQAVEGAYEKVSGWMSDRKARKTKVDSAPDRSYPEAEPMEYPMGETARREGMSGEGGFVSPGGRQVDVASEIQVQTSILEKHTDLLTTIAARQKDTADEMEEGVKIQAKQYEEQKSRLFEGEEDKAEGERKGTEGGTGGKGGEKKGLFRRAAGGLMDLMKESGETLGAKIKSAVGSLLEGYGLFQLAKPQVLRLWAKVLGLFTGAGGILSKAIPTLIGWGANLVKWIPEITAFTAVINGFRKSLDIEGLAEKWGVSPGSAGAAGWISGLTFGLSELVVSNEEIAKSLDPVMKFFSMEHLSSAYIHRMKLDKNDVHPKTRLDALPPGKEWKVDPTKGIAINLPKDTIATQGMPQQKTVQVHVPAGTLAEPTEEIQPPSGIHVNVPKGIGSVSGKYESGGNPGAISSGVGDFGGKSYGTYQMSTKTGTLNDFLANSQYGKIFSGLAVGSAAFDAKWKELAKTDPNFAQSQTDYIAATHFRPKMQDLKNAGIDLTNRGTAVQQAVWSTADQYGNIPIIQHALGDKDLNSMSDADIVEAIQDYKAKNLDSTHSGSTSDVRAGVARRIQAEKNDLLQMADKKEMDAVLAQLDQAEKEKKQVELARNSAITQGNVFAPRSATQNNSHTVIQLSSDMRPSDPSLTRELDRAGYAG